MNPRDGSPIDLKPGPPTNLSGMTYMLGTPIREWLDVKMLADEEGISIRGLVDQYRLLKNGERHRARVGLVVNKGMIWEAQEHVRLKIDRELIAAATREIPLRMELEQLRARESVLEERVASLERRLAKLANV